MSGFFSTNYRESLDQTWSGSAQLLLGCPAVATEPQEHGILHHSKTKDAHDATLDLLLRAHLHKCLPSMRICCYASKAQCIFAPERISQYPSHSSLHARCMPLAVGTKNDTKNVMEKRTNLRTFSEQRQKNQNQQKTRNQQQLTDLEYDRRDEPDRITAPVNKQIAVSELPTSSESSINVASSRPLTLFTMLYSSTKDLGKRIKLKVGISSWSNGEKRNKCEMARKEDQFHPSGITYLVYEKGQGGSGLTSLHVPYQNQKKFLVLQHQSHSEPED